MAGPNETTALEAAENATEAAMEAESLARESSAMSSEDVLEAAQSSVDAAHEAAEQIAEAALLTTLGQRITDVEERFISWQAGAENRADALETRLSEVEAENRSLRETVALLSANPSSAPVILPTLTPETGSILPASEMPITEADPSNLEAPPASAVVVPVEVPVRKRRGLRLL